MIEFLLGFLACAVLYTFLPDLAVIPSGLLRKAWARVNEWRKGP